MDGESLEGFQDDATSLRWPDLAGRRIAHQLNTASACFHKHPRYVSPRTVTRGGPSGGFLLWRRVQSKRMKIMEGSIDVTLIEAIRSLGLSGLAGFAFAGLPFIFVNFDLGPRVIGKLCRAVGILLLPAFVGAILTCRRITEIIAALKQPGIWEGGTTPFEQGFMPYHVGCCLSGALAVAYVVMNVVNRLPRKSELHN